MRTKPEQLRKYFQMIGACPLLLLGTLPLSHERAQASVLEARGAASSQQPAPTKELQPS